MTEDQKTQLLYLLSIASNELPKDSYEQFCVDKSRDIIKDIMSEEEIDYRAGSYEAEYPQ